MATIHDSLEQRANSEGNVEDLLDRSLHCCPFDMFDQGVRVPEDRRVRHCTAKRGADFSSYLVDAHE
jgi:hypothetical protein